MRAFCPRCAQEREIDGAGRCPEGHILPAVTPGVEEPEPWVADLPDEEQGRVEIDSDDLTLSSLEAAVAELGLTDDEGEPTAAGEPSAGEPSAWAVARPDAPTAPAPDEVADEQPAPEEPPAREEPVAAEEAPSADAAPDEDELDEDDADAEGIDLSRFTARPRRRRRFGR